MSAAEIGALSMRPERATLRAALRRGDALTAARAWERLRVVAESISVHERAAARSARKAVGRAIRDARYRRMQSAMDAFAPTAPAAAAEAAAARSRLVPVALAVAALAVVALLIVFFPRADEDYAPAAAAPAEVAQPTVVPTANTGGRGRTSETLAPLALVTPPPAELSAAPSATASAAASGAPGATNAAGAQPGGVSGGVTGGVVGGAPGGVVGGVVGGTGTKTLPPATPTPYILPRTPPQLPPGQDRFLFRVVDQSTGAALAGVCVNYGFAVCGPQDPHTNVDGLYWLDLNPGMATAWNFRFFKDDFLTANLNKTYRPGMGITTTTVFLRHL